MNGDVTTYNSIMLGGDFQNFGINGYYQAFNFVPIFYAQPFTAWTHTATDSSTISDSAVKAIGKTAADSVTTSDANVKSIGKRPADVATFIDALSKSIAHPAADSVTILENLLISITENAGDSVTISDAWDRTIGLLKSDSVTTSDLVTRVAEFYRTLSDSIALSDSVDAVFPENLDQYVNDAITLSDNVKIRINGRSIWYRREDVDFQNPNNGIWYARNEKDWI